MVVRAEAKAAGSLADAARGRVAASAAPAARDSQQRRVAAANRHRRRRLPRRSALLPAPAGLVPDGRAPPLPPIWIAPLVALQPFAASRGAV